MVTSAADNARHRAALVRLMGGAPGGTHRPGWPRHRRRPLLLLLPDAYAVTAKHGNFGALSCDTYCRSPAGGAQCTGGCSHAIDQATGWALTCDMVRGTTSDREVTCWCRGCLKGAGGAAAAARGRHALLEAAPPRPAVVPLTNTWMLLIEPSASVDDFRPLLLVLWLSSSFFFTAWYLSEISDRYLYCKQDSNMVKA